MSGITCGFIGLGLIGGSIARALKQSLPQVHIVAHDTDPGTPGAKRRHCRQDGLCRQRMFQGLRLYIFMRTGSGK